MSQAARRSQYTNSLYDSGVFGPVVPAGTEIVKLSLDQRPHGAYSLVVGNNVSAGILADFTNLEVRKNGQRLFRLNQVSALQPGFIILLDPNDNISVVNVLAGSAGATYQASLSLTLIQELTQNPDEAPDMAAVIASQQERIGETLDKLLAVMERLAAK